jgi:hypothetical protein
MEQDSLGRLQELAAHFRRLAAEHIDAGNQLIARKLIQVADEFDSKAARSIIGPTA